MKIKSSRSLWQSMALGLIAGLRSVSAGAVASHILKQEKPTEDSNKFKRFMHSDGFNTALNVMAVGELIADKLPFVPARTMPAGLAARVLSGGISSAAISKTNGENVILYAVLGSALAAGATYAFYHLRKAAGSRTGIADPLIALAEDAIVAGVGFALIKTSRKPG
ncbi:MAG TPA: DUF4126 family protein [Mucilaginibacter sp.]|nr:DUF4126 family protein [Mucilaginibacter sp.]